jgi:hypothetical protein
LLDEKCKPYLYVDVPTVNAKNVFTPTKRVQELLSEYYAEKITDGALSDQTRMRDGFIIVKVDDTDIKTIDDLTKALNNVKTITISGFYPGYDGLYDYPITLD